MPRTSKNSKLSATFTITLPATSANLGPAFDAAALALSMFLRVHAKSADEMSITARGVDADICGDMRDHLILNTYRQILDRECRRVAPLRLRLDNEIPIGKGCGSSAAARLAGIALANHYGHLDWDGNRIVMEAARCEGHVDNVAACWLGGLAIGRISDDGQVHVARMLPKGKWPLLLAIPDQSLPTEEARRILPKFYERNDAVTNIQNSMLLLAALTEGNEPLLAAALEDRIHQPYRAQLCPLLPALQPLSKQRGILGVALSGAGPSVLIFLDAKASPRKVSQRVRQQLTRQGLAATLIGARITRRGAAQSLC
ncbi:MAG TPA: homoserine kinase [Terriglobales bacterium]|nr:homoserine kinase [Terriglobales bacterium]